MKLQEMIKICPLAVDSRYPGSVVEINETLFGHQTFCAEACAPREMLELLQIHAPRFLHEPARLVIDAGKVPSISSSSLSKCLRSGCIAEDAHRYSGRKNWLTCHLCRGKRDEQKSGPHQAR